MYHPVTVGIAGSSPVQTAKLNENGIKKTQCRFRKKIEGGYSYTVGWVDTKKIKGKTHAQLKDFGLDFWEIIGRGRTIDTTVDTINTTFKNRKMN